MNKKQYKIIIEYLAELSVIKEHNDIKLLQTIDQINTEMVNIVDVDILDEYGI